MKIYVDDEREIFLYHYPIASIGIQSTQELDVIVDRMRQAKGYVPFFDWDGTETEYWDNGWYNFYLDFDLEKDLVVGFEVVVVGNTDWTDKEMVPDDETTYQLDFDVDDLTMQIAEQIDIEELKKEGREYYGEICD